MSLQQSADQLGRSALVAPPLHQDVQDLALGIDRAPQVHHAAADRDEHLVEVPAAIGLWPHRSQAACVGWTELGDPSAHRLIADVQAAFGQQILGIAQAQVEPQVKPDRMLDHGRRMVVTGVRNWLHQPRLATDPPVCHGSRDRAPLLLYRPVLPADDGSGRAARVRGRFVRSGGVALARHCRRHRRRWIVVPGREIRRPVPREGLNRGGDNRQPR